jgi:hypothetical protein
VDHCSAECIGIHVHARATRFEALEPLWVQHFRTIEELRQALLAFRETYNATWLIERHGFMSPAEFRQRQLQPVAEAA